MLRLTTLGALDLRDRLGRPVRDLLSQPKRIALLVHLAVEGRRGPVARDRVLAMFWPESDETRARNALSQALYHLRQAVGAELILSQGATLALAPDGLWCDALVFEDAIAAGEAELALDLYKGEFCPGLFVSGAGAVEEWLSEHRRDQRRRLLELARRGLQKATSAGDTTTAARLARRAMLLVPDDERDVRAYLTAIDAGGDVTGALSLYAEYVRRIALDLETEPAPETVALVERIKRRRAASVSVSVPVSAGPTDAPEPAPASAPPETVRAHPLRRLALLAVASVLLLVWGLSASGRLGAAAHDAADPDTPSAIAVFPFTVRGGDAAVMLGDGLAVLLAAKLDGTDDVRAIDPRSSTNATGGRSPAPAEGDALSRALGARYFVLGDLIERAGRLQMEAALYATDRPERAVASASVSGDSTALFDLVDELAGRLLATIVPARDTSLAKLAAVTTSSLPALKAYLRGERALREGQDARAAAAFREAASLDTNFALAQYRLALVANWISVPGVEDPVVWARAAARHDQRLTPLGRDLVEAFLAYKLPSSTAEARYQAIVQAYPDNVEAWYMLGEARYHYGPFDGSPAVDARAAFERVLALDRSNSHALVHLARIAAMEGDVDELAAIEARHRARYSDAERTIELRALLAWVRKDTAASRAIVEEARNADPIVLYGLTQAAALLSPALPDARRLALRLAEVGSVEVTRPYAIVMLSETTLGRGQSRFDAGIPAVRSAIRASMQQWHLEAEVLAAVEPIMRTPRARLLELKSRIESTRPYLALGVPTRALPRDRASETGALMRLHLLALLDLRLGDSLAARARLDSIHARESSADSAAAGRLASSLRAEMLRAAGKDAEALAELEQYPFAFGPDRLGHDGVRERFARAELLATLGRTDDALRWYETYPAYYDLVFLAPAAFRKAQLLERAGRRDDARWNYQRVIDLWSDADPDKQHLVREAREAVVRLR